MRALLLLCLPLMLALAGAAPAPAPPPTAPAERLRDEHEQAGSSWQAWLLLDSEDDDVAALAHLGERQGGSAPRRITPKSVFIAPSFTPDQLPACADGYRADAMGRCVKVLRVDQAAHLDFLLRRLNAAYASMPAAPPAPKPAPSPPPPVVPVAPAAAPPPAVSAAEPAPQVAAAPQPLPTAASAPPPLLPVAAQQAAEDPERPAGPLKVALPLDPTTNTPATTLETEPPSTPTEIPGLDAAGDDVQPEVIISLFGGQGDGDDEMFSEEPTVLSAGPPAEDVDVRDTLPMLVLTHTDASLPVESIPENSQSDNYTVSSTSNVSSTAAPQSMSTSQPPEVTLISSDHQHLAAGQMMSDASSAVIPDQSPSDPLQAGGVETNSLPTVEGSKLAGTVQQSSGIEVKGDHHLPQDITRGTVYQADNSAQLPRDAPAVTTLDRPQVSYGHSSSKKNGVGFSPEFQGHAVGPYGSLGEAHRQDWAPVTNRITPSDDGYVRFPQVRDGGYVRFPTEVLNHRQMAGGNRLWWLQQSPNGWRVRHPDPRYQPAQVRFYTRLPTHVHPQDHWNPYRNHA